MTESILKIFEKLGLDFRDKQTKDSSSFLSN